MIATDDPRTRYLVYGLILAHADGDLRSVNDVLQFATWIDAQPGVLLSLAAYVEQEARARAGDDEVAEVLRQWEADAKADGDQAGVLAVQLVATISAQIGTAHPHPLAPSVPLTTASREGVLTELHDSLAGLAVGMLSADPDWRARVEAEMRELALAAGWATRDG